jgi:hypothetical protein
MELSQIIDDLMHGRSPHLTRFLRTLVPFIVDVHGQQDAGELLTILLRHRISRLNCSNRALFWIHSMPHIQ